MENNEKTALRQEQVEKLEQSSLKLTALIEMNNHLIKTLNQPGLKAEILSEFNKDLTRLEQVEELEQSNRKMSELIGMNNHLIKILKRPDLKAEILSEFNKDLTKYVIEAIKQINL